MDAPQVRANRAVWDAIAPSFHSTRNKPWGTVVSFLESLPRGSLVLDAACGNGRHARVAAEPGHRVLGLDLSGRLLRLAAGDRRNRGVEWAEGVVERLPFKDARFDAVLLLAALHHVKGRAERIGVLDECLRVVRPGGRVLASAWSRAQPRFGPGREPRPAPGEPGDAWVKWTHHGLDVDRFFHLFDWDEWRSETASSQGRVDRVWSESIMTTDEPDNFFVVLAR